MSSYVTKKTLGDTRWFTHDRFGMFIHWGLYSMPARHEWIKSRECIPEDHYELYLKYFDPDMFDAKDWARRAKAAGMKYVIFTTKHHEGFCMYDSKYTDYKCTNTKAGRDLLKEVVDAFREEGLHIGLYYSLIDWHHPEFPIDLIHPRRNDPDAYEQSKDRDMSKYAAYMRNQVEELLTNYGKIDIMWFDFSYSHHDPEPGKEWQRGKGKLDWEAEELLATARRLQPDLIIDNRTEIKQDVWTPEQLQPTEWARDSETGELVVWEACQTLSGSWGYFRDEQTWKSPEMLIRMLINTVALGGNLLMNVGPTSRGYLDYRAEAALQVYADWMKYNSRSIYGCTMAEPELLEGLPVDCRYTQSQDGKRLYLHLFAYPYKYITLPNLGDKLEYAQFLHDGSEVQFTVGEIKHHASKEGMEDLDNSVVLCLPTIKPQPLVPVVELFLK